MAAASGSRHKLYYSLEGSYGVIPTNPPFTPIRHKSTTLGLEKNTFQSAEIRADRQITDFRHGTKNVAGEIMVEPSFESFDDLLEAVMCGTWATKATITGTTISAAAADDSFNDSGNGFVTAGFEVGDVITVTGFTGDVANNATYIVATVAAGKITVTNTSGGAASNIVDDAAGESVTIATTSEKLTSGTTRRSFTIEREFDDITQYLRFTGSEFNTFAMSVTPGAMVEGTFGVIGQGQDVDTAAVSGATYAAPTTNSPMDGLTGSITEGGSTIALVTEVQLNLDNGMVPLFVVGSAETIQPSIGRSNVTGQITAYFENTTLLSKFINETESALHFEIEANGDAYEFRVHRLKYGGGKPDVGGEGPVTLSMPFQSLYSSAHGSQLTIIKKPGV